MKISSCLILGIAVFAYCLPSVSFALQEHDNQKEFDCFNWYAVCIHGNLGDGDLNSIVGDEPGCDGHFPGNEHSHEREACYLWCEQAAANCGFSLDASSRGVMEQLATDMDQ